MKKTLVGVGVSKLLAVKSHSTLNSFALKTFYWLEINCGQNLKCKLKKV